MGRFAAVRQLMDLCPSTNNQVVLADFIRQGHLVKHVRRIRKIYAKRREVFVREIKHELGRSCTLFQDREIAAKAAEGKSDLCDIAAAQLASQDIR
ncbi:MAG TPA: hypothetical protein VJN89_17870 [Candidatus Acidoferrum sp.]|nr:hypothetical protein [Candidatus Acidoferrum sp.]